MKPEIEKQLEAILDERQKQERAARSRADERQQTAANNLADFLIARDKIIKPAFQEIVNLFAARGFTIRLTEENEYADARARSIEAGIALDMSGFYQKSSIPNPQFKLSFTKDTRNVSVYGSTDQTGGSRGNVSLDDLTAEWIHEAFLNYQSGKF